MTIEWMYLSRSIRSIGSMWVIPEGASASSVFFGVSCFQILALIESSGVVCLFDSLGILVVFGAYLDITCWEVDRFVGGVLGIAPKGPHVSV
jgi:hypothetical protein